LRRMPTSAESGLALGRHYGCKRISKSPVEYGFLRGWANTGSSTFCATTVANCDRAVLMAAASQAAGRVTIFLYILR
jgi:hypothetical protein